MSLNDIVNVTITALTTAPSRVGFGIPMILAYHTHYVDRAREYTSIDGMISDGFAADEPATRAAQAAFSQNPKPSKVVIGRAENDQKMKFKITPIAQNSTDYIVYINGDEYKYTSDTDATVAEITAGLKTVIDATVPIAIVTTDNITDLDIEASTIPVIFTLTVNDRNILKQANITPDLGGTDGVADDIAAVRLVNDDWYALNLTNLGKDVISAAAAYIEAQYKIMLTSSADDAIYDSGSTTDIAAVLQTAGYARTALMYHPKAIVQYPGAAWGGKNLPKDPGSVTWKFKTLAGVDYVVLTETEVSNIEAKDCNHYTRVAGISITQQGVTSASEFIDITRSIDFIRARLQEFIYARLANADKIPYTDPGVGVIEAEIWAVLRLSINQGILTSDPAPTVTVPLVADIPFTDRAARRVTGIKFEGTLAGAIHNLVIVGVVSV